MKIPFYQTIRLSLFLLFCTHVLDVQAITIESAGTGNWGTTTTWVGGVIPVAGDDVVIKATHAVTLSDTRSCATLTVETNATFNHSGVLNNSGAFLNQGTTVWAGTFSGSGSITNAGTLNISGIGNHNTAANITNNAGKTINWTDGQLDLNGGGQTLTNNGILNLIGTNLSNFTCSMAIVNTGTVNKTAGTLTITQALTNQAAGTVTVSTGASLTFTSGVITQSGTFTVDGTVSLSGSSHTFNTNFSGTGTLNISANSTVTAASGFAPAVATVNHNATLNAGASTALTIPSGTTWNWAGDFGNFTGITNDGTLNITTNSNHNTGANVTNNAGKTINWNDGYIDLSGGGQTLTNNGIFNLIGSNLNNFTCSMVIVNAGTVNKSAGALTITHAFTNQAGGAVTVSTGASLNFTSGVITQSGTFTVDGTVSLSGGSHTFNTNFSGTGTLNISANSTVTAASGFAPAVATVNHNATLNAGAGTALTIPSGTTWNWAGDFGNFTGITNDGTLNITTNSNHNTGANITNNAGKTINWNDGNLDFTTGQTLTNNGVFNLIGSNLNNFACNMAIVNAGTLNKSAGTLTITQPLTNQAGGTVTVSTGATLTFTSGALTQSGTFTVDGTVSLSGSSHTFNTNFSGTGTLTIGATSTVTAASGFAPAVATVNHNTTLNAGAGTALTIPSGTTWNWAGDFGNFTGITNDGTLNITTNSNHNTGADIINNAGKTIHWTDGNLDLTTGQTLTNNGIFNLIGSNLNNFACNMAIVNAGTLNKTAGTLTITQPLTNQAAGTVTISTGATLTFTSGVLTQNGIFTVNGTVSLNGSSHTFNTNFSGTGTLTIGATTTVTAASGFAPAVATVNHNSTLNAGAGTALTIPAGTTWNWAGDFGTFTSITNDGTLNVIGNNQHNTSANITNNAGKTINWNSGAIDAAGGGGGQTLTNNGILNLIGNNPNNFSCHMPIVNTGTMNKTAGDLNILQSLDNQAGGTVTISTGATLTFITGTLTQSGTFTVNGTLNLNGGTLVQTQLFAVDGTVNINTSYTFGTGGGFSGTGTVNIAGGISTFNAGSTLSTKLSISSSTLADNVGLMPGQVTLGSFGIYGGTGSPTFANGFILNGGTLNGSGTVLVSGSMSLNNGASITGDKEIHLSGTGTVNNTASLSLSGNAKVRILSGGTLTLNGTGDITSFGGSNNLLEIQTGGTLVKSGANTYSLALPFSLNGGDVVVNVGTFSIGPAVHTLSNGTVVLNGASIFRINSSTANITGTAISGTGTLLLSASTTNVQAGTVISTKINISSGTLNDNAGLQPGEVTLGSAAQAIYGGSGSPAFANGFIWVAGDLKGSGVITVSGTLTANNGLSPLRIQDTKELHITGTATFTNASFSMTDNGKFIVKSGGIVNFIVSSSNLSVGGGVNNLFELESGSTLLKTGNNAISITVPFKMTNATIQIDAGTLTVGGGTFNHFLTGGMVSVAASATFGLSSGVIDLTGVQVSGAGTSMLLGPGSNVQANSGTVISTKLNIAGGILYDNVGLAPGEVTLGSNATNFGVYAGTGSPVFSNGFTWIHGTFQGSGQVTVNSAMSVPNNFPHAVAATEELRIAGPATFDAGAGLTMSSTAKTTVTSTGSVTFQGASSISLTGTNATLFEIQNGGTMTKTGAGSLFSTTPLSNAGTLSIEAGLVNLNNSFTNSGTVKGTGALDLGTTNTNTGTYAPGLSPGTLSVTGNYTNSILDIEIEAGMPVAKDLLNVTGNITLTGSTLHVSEVQCVAVGTYDIISYTGTRTGTFATLNMPVGYSVIYNDGAKKVQLQYVDGLPTIICPPTVNTNTDPGVCSAGSVALGTPTGTDNCTGVVYTNDAPGTFLIGSSVVVWTATDVINQSATCEQTVVVSDAEAPVVTCPADQTISINGICSTTIGNWNPVSVDDNCTASGAITVSQSPASTTALYGPGDSETVTLTAEDQYANSQFCTFIVTLNITSVPQEICNGLDDDCDGLIDDADPSLTGQPVWYADTDGDGYGNAAVSQLACNQPSGYVSNDDDCNDGNPAVNPAATEICNGLDDDCDGLTDDADPGITGQSTWYADTDGDGYGNAAVSQLACNQPSGFVSNDDDCNDGNPAINPAATEICNGLDDDCDGLIDDADPSLTGQPVWYADTDGDGYGNAAVSQLACNQPSGYVSNDDDCNDGNPAINPAATEICNGLDDDCDGLTDDADPGITGQSTWYADTDGDGYGNAAVSQLACNQPSGYVANDDDCNDSNPAVNPAATEICNGLDDDCDGLTDEVCNDNTISGVILWEYDDASGVKDTKVDLTGDQTGFMNTPLNGTYTFTVSSGSAFTITPTKTINKLNGVTSADALRIQQHITNSSPITDPYKQVAADVNKSNSITTLDAVVINQALLGNPAGLNQFKTSWRFVPASHTMTLPPWGFPEKIILTGVNGDVPGQDFYGIKTGDVVATFANPANFGAGNAWIFEVQDQVLQAGSQVTVEFRAGQFFDLAALQCALHFDPGTLSLLTFQALSGMPLSEANFGTWELDEGIVRVVWSQSEGADIGEAAQAFSLTFQVLEGGSLLSEVLQLDETVLPARAYSGVLEESAMQLQFSEVTTNAGSPSAMANSGLLQNRPNPFRETTTIGFLLPEACEASLRIFEASGRLLTERRSYYAAGKHEEVFESLHAFGLLYYELTTPFGTWVRKMSGME